MCRLRRGVNQRGNQRRLAAGRELAAGGVDVVAARRADVRLHAVPPQDVLKCSDSLRGGSLEHGARERIPGNQIHHARKTLQQARQPVGVGVAVVDPGQEDVFERYFATVGQRELARRG